MEELWRELLIAGCLLLIIEGFLPFLSPSRFRRMIELLSEVDERSIRLMGLGSMLLGTVLLYIIR